MSSLLGAGKFLESDFDFLNFNLLAAGLQKSYPKLVNLPRSLAMSGEIFGFGGQQGGVIINKF
jgi:hypothetical protein